MEDDNTSEDHGEVTFDTVENYFNILRPENSILETDYESKFFP
jgi:hypothetical protein